MYMDIWIVLYFREYYCDVQYVVNDVQYFEDHCFVVHMMLI